MSSGALAGKTVVTLGGPDTFAGQALAALCDATDIRPLIGYRTSMDDVWEVLDTGAADGVLLTAESTHAGVTDVAARLLADSGLSVVAEVVVPYHCTLLGKSGTDLSRVRRVTGHGSLIQCQDYLSKMLPGVPVEIHRGNSMAAAEEVATGDGSVVVVGTLAAAERFRLEILAEDVDGGAEGAWWVLGKGPAATDGDTAVVEISLRPDADWAFPADVVPAGWALRSVLVEPRRDALWSGRLLTVWRGSAMSAEWSHPSATVRGRFDSVSIR